MSIINDRLSVLLLTFTFFGFTPKRSSNYQTRTVFKKFIKFPFNLTEILFQ